MKGKTEQSHCLLKHLFYSLVIASYHAQVIDDISKSSEFLERSCHCATVTAQQQLIIVEEIDYNTSFALWLKWISLCC